MSIDISAAFSDGVDEFLSRKGAALAVVFFVVSVASSLATGSVILAIADRLQQSGEATQFQLEQLRAQAQFGLDTGLGPAVALLLVLGLGAELARVVAIRALADTSTSALRPKHYTGGVLRVYRYRILVSIVLLVLYAVLGVVLLAPAAIFPPLVLLVVPVFLYVAIALYFAPIAVVVDETGPLDAISNAWTYANGNRLRLVAIAIGVVIVSFVITAPNLLFTGVTNASGSGVDAITSSPIAVVVSGVFGSLSAVFTLAVATSTYRQLASDSPLDAGGAGNADQFGTETEF